MACCDYAYLRSRIRTVLHRASRVMGKVIKSTLHCTISYRSLPAIAILVLHVLCVTSCVYAGMTWPDAVTKNCNPLLLATQRGLRLAVWLMDKNSTAAHHRGKSQSQIRVLL